MPSSFYKCVIYFQRILGQNEDMEEVVSLSSEGQVSAVTWFWVMSIVWLSIKATQCLLDSHNHVG